MDQPHRKSQIASWAMGIKPSKEDMLLPLAQDSKRHFLGRDRVEGSSLAGQNTNYLQ